jgi:hypothetical protein
MQNNLYYTVVILLVVVAPLLFLYTRGNWPLRKVVPYLVILPALWYLAYAPIHELSHTAGAYLVGGKVIAYKLIPRFWLGEFAGAWITPSGLPYGWQQFTMTSFPYLLDVVCFVAAIIIFRRSFSKNPFLLGLAFMLLCLRPACDFVFEPLAFLYGDRNDLYALQQAAGPVAIWSFLLVSITLAGYSIGSTLHRVIRFSRQNLT